MPQTEVDIVLARQEKQATIAVLRTLLEEEPTISENIRTCAAQFADDQRFAILTSEELAREVLGRVLSEIEQVQSSIYFKLYQEALHTIQELRDEGITAKLEGADSLVPDAYR